MNQFLTNYTEQTFLDKLKENLQKCDTFYFSVSFIKKAGLLLLYKDIENALERGAKGKIITSTYQNFTDIESLNMFLNLQKRFTNFSCHLDYESFRDQKYMVVGYHSKGYLFEYEDENEVIIGSSNLTRYALLKNIEWDLLLSEEKNSKLYNEVLTEFNDKWNNTFELTNDLIKSYAIKMSYAIERWDMDYDYQGSKIKPNFMQRKALKELNRIRAMGVTKALTIAAAGSGKTYLAAFDALNFMPKRLLYIVHEGSILMKSLDTFKEVFTNTVSYGVFNGQYKEIDCDFIFATNMTMSKSLELFSKDEFDYIIVDECHHATAETYKKIINYFEPEFLLGLTATPERMDNQDVFELFDKNVPYELRLRDAIINDLVVPFKYYGIRDQLTNYGLSKKEEKNLIAQLSTTSHCDFITNEIEKHRPKGKLKALAFCKNISHARMMCEEMSSRYHTAYLTGKNDIGERIRAYNDLQSDDKDLEILFTVDILNEGVDIPGVNMVLFLRPTESSTIFIQQLGRGLRKYENKDYVTVLDFIGNSYKRSVQIAFALSSLSENMVLEKRLMMSFVKDDFKSIGLNKYGVEIHIDNLSKEEILNYIEKENFNRLEYLKQDYFNFKKYIGTEPYPKHIDYLNSDYAPDLLRFLQSRIDNKKCVSYYRFLRGISSEDQEMMKLLPLFTDNQMKFIDYLSNMLPLVRKYEFEIIKCILKGINSIFEITDYVRETIYGFNNEQLDHAIEYMVKSEKVFIDHDCLYLNNITLDDEFIDYVEDLLNYGLSRYETELGDEVAFKLWHNYRKDQVQLKLLENPGSTARGTYYYDGTVVIFANLKKDASIAERLNYKDRFINPSLFQWQSVSTTLESEFSKLQNSKEVLLFIRKFEKEYGITLPFTYVGKGKLSNPRKQEHNYLFDICMEEELPEYLQFDFGLKE